MRGADEVRVQHAADACEERAEREGDETLAQHVDARRPRRRLVLPRGLQRKTVARNLVELRGGDRGDSPGEGDPGVDILGNADDRARARSHRLPVAVNDMHDCEKAERADRSREAAKAHQHQADEEAHRGGEQARDYGSRKEGHRRVDESIRQPRQLELLERRPARLPRNRVGADRGEGNVTEGEHARIADKDVKGDDQHDPDQPFGDGSLQAPVPEARYQRNDGEESGGQNEERPNPLGQTSERRGADHLDAFLERPYADQPLRTEHQNQDDEEENESVAVGS